MKTKVVVSDENGDLLIFEFVVPECSCAHTKEQGRKEFFRLFGNEYAAFCSHCGKELVRTKPIETASSTL